LVSLLASASSSRFTMAMFSILTMSVAAGPVVVIVLHHRVQRTATFLAGLLIAVTNFLTTLSIGLINSTDIRTVLSYATWAAGGGLLSAVLCIGLQPLLEWMFNLVSSAKLLELSNPNHPLLRRMLLEAPGTYHHSIIVANLAEAAADAVGANGLLARVGAYYHDVGKLKRPIYFKENQMGDNPHMRTDPRVSTAILTAHTRDGVQMAQKARIPEPVIDIIREHHGDTPVIYFYDKALKQYGEDIDISAFRYDGPRPRTKESAIVMLADTVEAAARAMSNPDPDAMDQLIRKLVRGKMADGQLDQSELTFNDLDRICSAFFTVLGGVFHERIEYPDVEIPPRTEHHGEAETSTPASENSESSAEETPDAN
ncbi:MAG: HDIG domain-containing protein, partial [Eubacteriales bacterium]|nr:HDIG domain-containing protein [Eubacteriales bacterium]